MPQVLGKGALRLRSHTFFFSRDCLESLAIHKGSLKLSLGSVFMLLGVLQDCLLGVVRVILRHYVLLNYLLSRE